MEAKWETTEKVIQFIEKSITLDASVKHNVRLPDLLLNDGSSRQCDIVIITGKPPRETILIVEVQDRKSKVQKATFDGWV